MELRASPRREWPAVEEEEEDGPSASYWELLKDFHKDQHSIEVWRQRRQRQADLRQDRKENCSKPEHPPDPPDDHPLPFREHSFCVPSLNIVKTYFTPPG